MYFFARQWNTAATVFSHMHGAVGRAPLFPPSTGVRTIWPVSGRCFTRYSAPSSPETTSCTVLKRRARCCLGLIWAKAFFPLLPLPRPMTKSTDNRQ